MCARTTEMEPHARAGQTTYTNMHKANLRSQLSIFDTSSFSWSRPRPNDLPQMPSNNPPEQFYMGACTTETKPQGRAGQTSFTNMHKANLRSQLSIFDTGSFTRARLRLNDPPKQIDTDALKRPARTN